MSNRLEILKQYSDALILQWDNSIWAIRADGDAPTLWPVAHISKDNQGQLSITIPRGTDIANANAVLSSLNLPSNLFD